LFVVERLLRALRIIFWIHIVGGFTSLVALALASPWVIGRGRVESVTHELESYDFKWWLVAVALILWIVPIVLVITWRNAKRAGLEVATVKAHVREMLEGRSFPVMVDVNTLIPVRIERPLDVDFKVDAKIDVDDRIEVEGSIPLSIELPIDTEITTSVFGLGSVKIPIRARVPINIVVPLHTTMHVRASGIPVKLEEKAHVLLPVIEVPIKSRIDARIDILRTLELGTGG